MYCVWRKVHCSLRIEYIGSEFFGYGNSFLLSYVLFQNAPPSNVSEWQETRRFTMQYVYNRKEKSKLSDIPEFYYEQTLKLNSSGKIS